MKPVHYTVDVPVRYNVKKNKLGKLYPEYTYAIDKEAVTLDSLIASLIVELNKHDGVETLNCCSGHEGTRSGYIMFHPTTTVIALCTELVDISTTYLRDVGSDQKCTVILEVSNDGVKTRGLHTVILRLRGMSRKERYELFNLYIGYLKSSR